MAGFSPGKAKARMVVATTHQALNLEGVAVQRLLVGNVAIPELS